LTFFRLSVCALVANGEFLAIFECCIGLFLASRVQHVSDLHPKFAVGLWPHHVWRYMVDIESATAENRLGKKDRRKKPQDKNIMSASATQGGHKKCSAVTEMGDRLATIDMGRKLCSVPPFGGGVAG